MLLEFENKLQKKLKYNLKSFEIFRKRKSFKLVDWYDQNVFIKRESCASSQVKSPIALHYIFPIKSAISKIYIKLIYILLMDKYDKINNK